MNILTIEEAARILGLNSHTVYRYAREGRIPAVRIGRSWRIMRETLEEWFREKAAKSMELSEEKKKAGKKKLPQQFDPLLEVIGIIKSGELTKDLDKELYEEKES